MKKFGILDCTLRDGGFVNNWNFGEKVIDDIFAKLDASGIDIIEVGYLYDKEPYGTGYTRFNDTDAVNSVFGKKSSQAMLVAMIDYGQCDISHVGLQRTSGIDGIRITFKKKEISEALEFCKEVLNRGYKVFCQPVSVTTYSDQEILDLINKINELEPYALSIVDTYGLLDKQKVLHYFSLLDANLKASIGIGYHGHNNLQLANSNAMAILSINTSRLTLIDSSVYGMGKSAGNACTELLTMYANQNFGKKYDISNLLEIIDNDVKPFYLQNQWGYSSDFYIAALNRVHPKYVAYLRAKNLLSVSCVNQILAGILPEKKLSYDEAYIENLCVRYGK